MSVRNNKIVYSGTNKVQPDEGTGMVNLCSRNEKHTILLGKYELRVYVGVAIVVRRRTVIEFGMGDWKEVICLKIQSNSRPMCLRFIFNFKAWGGNFKTTTINVSVFLYEVRTENNLTMYIFCCVHSVLI